MQVIPGSTVTFEVNAVNNIVPGTSEVQRFLVTIEVLGDGVTVLDVHDVFILVPPGSGTVE